MKNYVRKIGNKVDNIGAAVSAFAGGVAMGQFPQYLAQYMQRFDEAIYQNLAIGKSEGIVNLVKNANEMRQGYSEIAGAAGFGKLGAFIQNVDVDVAQRAFDIYVPGMAFDSVSLGYMAFGAGVGYLAYEMVKFGCKQVIKRIIPKN